MGLKPPISNIYIYINLYYIYILIIIIDPSRNNPEIYLDLQVWLQRFTFRRCDKSRGFNHLACIIIASAMAGIGLITDSISTRNVIKPSSKTLLWHWDCHKLYMLDILRCCICTAHMYIYIRIYIYVHIADPCKVIENKSHGIIVNTTIVPLNHTKSYKSTFFCWLNRDFSWKNPWNLQANSPVRFCVRPRSLLRFPTDANGPCHSPAVGRSLFGQS